MQVNQSLSHKNLTLSKSWVLSIKKQRSQQLILEFFNNFQNILLNHTSWKRTSFGQPMVFIYSLHIGSVFPVTWWNIQIVLEILDTLHISAPPYWNVLCFSNYKIVKYKQSDHIHNNKSFRANSFPSRKVSNLCPLGNPIARFNLKHSIWPRNGEKV